MFVIFQVLANSLGFYLLGCGQILYHCEMPYVKYRSADSRRDNNFYAQDGFVPFVMCKTEAVADEVDLQVDLRST